MSWVKGVKPIFETAEILIVMNRYSLQADTILSMSKKDNPTEAYGSNIENVLSSNYRPHLYPPCTPCLREKIFMVLLSVPCVSARETLIVVFQVFEQGLGVVVFGVFRCVEQGGVAGMHLDD